MIKVINCINEPLKDRGVEVLEKTVDFETINPYICPKCGKVMKWDGLVRCSIPPQYLHKCTCGYSTFLKSHNI